MCNPSTSVSTVQGMFKTFLVTWWVQGQFGTNKTCIKKKIKENLPKVTEVFSDETDCASRPRLSTANCCKLCLPICTSNERTFVSCCTVTVCHTCHNTTGAERHQWRDKTIYLPGIKNGFPISFKTSTSPIPLYIASSSIGPSPPGLCCTLFCTSQALRSCSKLCKGKGVFYIPHASSHMARGNCLLINWLKSEY